MIRILSTLDLVAGESRVDPCGVDDSERVNSMGGSRSDMSVSLRHPTKRVCERCGRTERWDDTTESWQVDDDAVGSIYCIHEWDINGSFVPFKDHL